MGFLDFLGKAAGTIGKVASVANTVLPKVAQGVKGVTNIVNAYKSGSGQREAISSFIGDMAGSKWGNLANQAIGAGEQIFKTGKSVVATAKGFKSNPMGTLQNMASGVGKIGNILGSTTKSISGALGGSSIMNKLQGTKLGGAIQTGQNLMKQAGAVAGAVGQTYNAGKAAYQSMQPGLQNTMQAASSLRSAFRR